MKASFILLYLVGILVPPALSAIAAWKFRMYGLKVSGVLLALTLAAFAILTCQPRFAAALDDNVPFSIPGDYHDHTEYGWPFGFWRHYPEQGLNRLEHQVDLRGVVVDMLFWGYCGFVAVIPGVAQLIARRMTRRRSIQ